MATVSRATTSGKYRFIARNQQLGISILPVQLVTGLSERFLLLARTEAVTPSSAGPASYGDNKTIFTETRDVYGSPRMHRALLEKGIRVGKKRVGRLMRTSGLRARVVLVTRRQQGLKKFMALDENFRHKAPQVTGINQQWVSDITYFKANRRWLYLATVMDVYSRRIIGWSLGGNRTVNLVVTALQYALERRNPQEGLIFHTDRGTEYRNYRFRGILAKHGLRASVNRPGQCTDNAHMASFFHSLKAELIRGRSYADPLELRLSLNSYINQFYNHKRLHSGIGYCTPAQFEAANYK